MRTVGLAFGVFVLLGAVLVLLGAVLSVPWAAWFDLIRSQPLGLRFVLMGLTVELGAVALVILAILLAAAREVLQPKKARR